MRRIASHAVTAAVVTAALVAPLLVAAAPSKVLLAQPAGATSASATAASSAAASGAPAPAMGDEEKKSAAIEHFGRGVEQLQNGSYDSALAEFTASLDLYPTKNARKNAAICLRELKRYDEALEMYQRLLQDFGSKLSPADLDIVNKAIEELKELTGTLTINSSIAGATVVIDGKERGKTPLSGPVLVSSGTRVVRVTKEGYVPFEAKESVAGKTNVTVDATLEALARSGRLKVIESANKVLDVVVDGAVVGKTPYEGALEPGPHAVLLRGEGRLGTQPAAAAITVDQTTVVRLSAEELEGDARIDSDPSSATVVLDGVLLGQGTWEGHLRAGSHKVDLSAEGYFGASKTFDTGKDKPAVVKVTLDRDESSPFWAKGRRRPLLIGVFGSFAYGKSLGGDYESSCGSGCSGHSGPLGILAGVRGAYALENGLAIELDLGFAYLHMKNSRNTTLLGDGGPVPVNISDDVTAAAPLFGVGLSYPFVRSPVSISGALTVGLMLAKVKEKRSGTVTTDNDPTERALNSPTTDPVSKAIPFFLPEIRIGFPIGDRFVIGIGLGVLIGSTDARPKVQQSVPPSPNDFTVGKDPLTGAPTKVPSGATYNGKAIGFLPRGNTSESAIGTFILPEASLFARLAF